MSRERDGGSPGRIAIVGLGLVGGSLARALKETDDPPWIGASSLESDALSRAAADGVVDRAFPSARNAAAAGDLVVYATPLDATLELVAKHRDRWRPDAVVTDVVSVKTPLLERMRELGAAGRYVGGHPMAGSEETGFGASRPDLFRGALTYLIRGDAPGDHARRVEGLWHRVGARTAWIDPRAHDRRMALVSHLPQLTSSALATVLGRAGRDVDDLGPGARDMTRLASSPSGLWRGLLGALADDDAAALRALVDEIDGLVTLLEEGRLEALEAYMDRSRRWREGEEWS